MTKKILLFIGILIIIGGGTAIIMNKKEQKKDSNQNPNQTENVDNTPVARINNDQLIMYYGNGCPHCKIIEDYITAEKLDKKLSIEQKEVWYNTGNANELKEKAKICNIPDDQVGVPLIFDTKNNKCFVGEDEAKTLFNEKLNAPTN